LGSLYWGRVGRKGGRGELKGEGQVKNLLQRPLKRGGTQNHPPANTGLKKGRGGSLHKTRAGRNKGSDGKCRVVRAN